MSNKLDAVLEDIIREYEIEDGNIQRRPFQPQTKQLLLAILKFERMLLENTTNRKLFTQYDVCGVCAFKFRALVDLLEIV